MVNISLINFFNLNKSKLKSEWSFKLIVVESAVSSFVSVSIYSDIFGHIRIINGINESNFSDRDIP